MAFGQTPTTSTQGALGSNQIPIPSVYPPNTSGSNTTHDFIALGAGPVHTDDDGNKYAGNLTAVKDGDNATDGATTDPAVTGDTSGTKSAKLRGINKILFDMWDSANHWLQV